MHIYVSEVINLIYGSSDNKAIAKDTKSSATLQDACDNDLFKVDGGGKTRQKIFNTEDF